MPFLIEACVETLEQALSAERAGADRIELCGNLDVGGTLPERDDLRQAIDSCGVPVYPIVRLQGSNFVLDADEVEITVRVLAAMRGFGVPGAVIGAITSDGAIDRDALARMQDAAGPMDLTFHKAFDAVRDQAEALDTLMTLGIPRVLTSGGAASAWQGRERIASLVRQAAGRITVMPGGGITAGHGAQLVAETGATEIHLRATDEDRFREVAGALR